MPMHLRESLIQDRRDEHGSTTVMAAISVVAILLCLGFLVDQARQLRAVEQIDGAAQEAGRAAAQELGAEAIRGQAATLNPGRAAAAARSYLAQVGVPGSVSVQGTTIVITTSQAWTPVLLPVGGHTLHGHATIDMTRVAP